MVKARITCLLTQEAQRAALAAGKPLSREQTFTVDLSPDDLQYFHIDENGLPYPKRLDGFDRPPNPEEALAAARRMGNGLPSFESFYLLAMVLLLFGLVVALSGTVLKP